MAQQRRLRSRMERTLCGVLGSRVEPFLSIPDRPIGGRFLILTNSARQKATEAAVKDFMAGKTSYVDMQKARIQALKQSNGGHRMRFSWRVDVSSTLLAGC